MLSTVTNKSFFNHKTVSEHSQEKCQINSFSPRAAKTATFIILPCIMPEHFNYQQRGSTWETVITLALKTTENSL